MLLRSTFTLCFIFSLFIQTSVLASSYLYHGSLTDGIQVLEPRQRYTPGNEESSPAGVYAASDPAYAAAHSFPWSSDEGIDLYFDRDENEMKYVVIEIPEKLVYRLDTPVFIYTVPAETFSLLECSCTGDDYRSLEKVECVDKIRFESVRKAILHYNGKIIIRSS